MLTIYQAWSNNFTMMNNGTHFSKIFSAIRAQLSAWYSKDRTFTPRTCNDPFKRTWPRTWFGQNMLLLSMSRTACPLSEKAFGENHCVSMEIKRFVTLLDDIPCWFSAKSRVSDWSWGIYVKFFGTSYGYMHVMKEGVVILMLMFRR